MYRGICPPRFVQTFVLLQGLFKTKKNMQKSRDEMSCASVGMMSLSSNLKLCSVCVFILFHLLAFSDCKTSATCLRCSDQRSFVVSIAMGLCQVPSSPFPNLSYFTSKDITPAGRQNWRENDMVYWNPVKR